MQATIPYHGHGLSYVTCCHCAKVVTAHLDPPEQGAVERQRALQSLGARLVFGTHWFCSDDCVKASQQPRVEACGAVVTCRLPKGHKGACVYATGRPTYVVQLVDDEPTEDTPPGA